MYLKAKDVAARYGIDECTLWRRAKDMADPFPMPVYFGPQRTNAGFGDVRLGSRARWSTRDLLNYDTGQRLLHADDIRDEAERASFVAALRRRYPELNSEPAAVEQQAQAAYEAKHAGRVAAQVKAGVPLAIARDMATSELRGFV